MYEGLRACLNAVVHPHIMKRSNIKVIAVATVAIVIVLLFSYAYVGNDDGDDSLSGEVYIIHTNDTHGYYDENLGFTRVAALRGDLESRGATVFMLDTGDAFQGTGYTMLTHGGSSVDILNAVGYDLMVPGNHEFDYGFETYLDNAAQLEFDTISANLCYADTGELVFEPYRIIDRDGYRLGVFGLCTPDTLDLVMPGYLDDITITDPVEASRQMVEVLQGEDVDCIVALGHIGIDPSSSITSDQICAEVDGIDLFIDGHSHTVMSGGEVVGSDYTLQESDTLIASTGYALQHIGLVCLTSDEGYTAELVDSYDDTDPEIDAVIAEMHARFDETMGEVIGHSEIELTGERTQSRLMEVGLGDFVTDTIRELTGADVALYNGGSIRAPIAPGDITVGMVYESFPFENYVVTKILTGEQLIEVLEGGLAGLPGAAGGYLQVSGITVTYDSSQPAGSRIVSVIMADGSQMDPDETYLVASNDYVMAGGDNYPILAEIEAAGQHGLVYDALFDRFSEIGTITTIDTGRLTDIASTDADEQ